MKPGLREVQLAQGHIADAWWEENKFMNLQFLSPLLLHDFPTEVITLQKSP